MGGTYFVYMLSNKKQGVLYTGVTNNLSRRVWDHVEGQGSAFVRKYGLDKLVYCESFVRVDEAIAYEKRLKKWRRDWKIQLIEKHNPDWRDLSDDFPL
ncbi:MAG: GIY-YIG nuclease family protein [Pseudomonadota bacterium]